LCLYLVDVYGKAELEVDSESKGRIFTLLRAFPPDEPTRKRFIGEALAWTAKFGEYEYGDPELHHIAGTLYAECPFFIIPLAPFPHNYYMLTLPPQPANPTTRNGILPSAPETRLNSSPFWNTHGTHKTRRTPPLFTVPVPYSPISSHETSAPHTKRTTPSPRSCPPRSRAHT
jgi:hypothetical protein